MKVIKSTEELINLVKNYKYKKVGLVPTMGALHEGHISLIKRARKDNDIVIVSIFVNPTQFLEGEDFNKYPKQLDKDLEKCRLENIDIVFAPNIEDMYQDKDEVSIIAPKRLGYILEGYNRPKHFDGVLQIVLKLFNITKPTNAYFGKKDAQQLAIIQKMVKDLFLDINIIPCEIVREKNSSLALSSRNVYLSEEEKKESLKLSKSLFRVKELVDNNILEIDILKKEALKILEGLNVEYFEIVDNNFNNIKKVILNNSKALVAVKLKSARLIDNIDL